MRTGVVAVALALLVLAPLRPARAQFSFDARRIGMGGLTLSRDGNARRYNPAYRAVKNKNKVSGAPKFSIPVPFGLIQFFKDHPINQLGQDPMFDPKSPAFNPVALMDVIFNPPIFYEIKKAPTPTNDVEFTIGRNQLVVDLGATKVLIPESDFGLGTTSRLFDAGVGFAGFNVASWGFCSMTSNSLWTPRCASSSWETRPARNRTRRISSTPTAQPKPVLRRR